MLPPKRHITLNITSVVLLAISLFFLPSFSTVFYSTNTHASLTPPSPAKASDSTNTDPSTPDWSQNAQANTRNQNQTVQSSPASAIESTPPSQPPTSSMIVQGQSAEVVWSVPTTERAVFITIDDGWFPSQSLLQMMRKYHFPVTTFLIQQAAQEHPDYWKAFVAAGGDIENHTLSHPDLTKIASEELDVQLLTPIKYLGHLATPPTLFRPPYGAYNPLVLQEVYKAGMRYLVMWNAVMNNGVLQTYNGKSIQPGAIIILHWEPGLSTQIKDLIGILQQEHLGIASLPEALAHPDKFSVTWLSPEKTAPPVNGSSQQPSSNKADPSAPSVNSNGA